ncbi:MAG: FecR domain-containing protein [Deltaproteobacteria bacterium]
MRPEQPLEGPEPSLPQARIERQWTQVRDRLEGRAASRPWWAGVAAMLATGAVAFLAWHSVAPHARTTRLAEGSSVETTREPVHVALEEGSGIEVAVDSRLSVEETRGSDVAVRLHRGEARFDVVRRSSGAFRVRASTGRGEPVEVVVVGTTFTVGHEDTEVSVRVERGVVEVHAAGQIARLTAGDAWRSSPPAPSADLEARVGPGGREELEEASEGFVESPEGSDEAPEGFDEAPEGFPTASESAATAPAGASARRASRTRGTPDARALFELAREARQAGSVAEAARLYGEIVVHHGDDPRADVAAFELARLRMDHLGDPRGALGAIDRALGGRGGAFREDAMARRAVLLDRLGRDRECRSAREAYLAAFGAGVHRAEVGALCP